MTKAQRKEHLMPGGIPKHVRCYDDVKNPVADHFTVVFTRMNGHYPYLAMGGEPFHPQGIGQHGESRFGPVDRPTYSHLGRRIKFTDLPDDCQKLVVRDYVEYHKL